MEVLSHIPVEINFNDLLQRLHIAPGDRDAESVAALVEWAKPIMNPKAIYDICYIGERTADTMEINGVTFASRVLRVNLDHAHRVFPYIITSGTELEVQSNVTGDPMEFYWFDEIKFAALRAASVYLNHHLVSKYKLGKIAHMAPGSLEDWPITQQTQLFSLFGNVEQQIGVKLTDTFLMVPTKSVSGVIFPTEVSFESCQLCPRDLCPGRRAPYDEQQWKKYQQ